MREYLVDDYVRDGSDAPIEAGLRAGSLLEVPRDEVCDRSYLSTVQGIRKQTTGISRGRCANAIGF